MDCILCLATFLKIIVSPAGECIAIQADGKIYPCTIENKIDTGCWDSKLEGQLCTASFIELEGDYGI